ncbi:DJ-1/PfpI family protein [Clathrospora elynae]|uniref:DJ-1/PfpI family protein n=1 Tax=Clathrospora elynae TaxID=706981 RepID=A0A6A5STR8_9PLEO|nr:DJ-1/PfpI family protein [Clathrospora elynae]
MRPSTLILLLAALPSALAAPSQPDFTNTTKLPTHFGLLLFPHFQALDVFGPMDVLNSLFMLYANSTVTHLSILSKTMKPVTTAMRMSNSGDFGQKIVPTITFADYLTTHKGYRDEDFGYGRGDIEVLFVPGGGGTRDDMTEEIEFVRSVYPKLKHIVSVCTGATILARAGILDGRKATTNKRSWAWATSTGPKVTWVPTARWVEDGNIISSSGVSAGTDAAYAWVSRVYGENVARYLALSSEYNREVDPHHDPYGKTWDVPGAT